MTATPKRRGMDLGQVLLWSAVLVEAPRWAGAMLAADLKDVSGLLSSALNTGNTVSGVAMGLVNVVATAYMLDALRREKPVLRVQRRNPKGKAITVDKANWRFYGLMVFVIGLLVLTPIVLAPFMVSRMTGQGLALVLGNSIWQMAWSTTVVLAPIFVIGGVSFAQPGLVNIGSQQSAASSQSGPKVSMKHSEPVAESNDGKPATFGKWKTWRKVPEIERQKIATMNVDEVKAAYGVEERTAYNWMKDAKAPVATETEPAEVVVRQTRAPATHVASVGDAGKKPARRKKVVKK